MPMLADIDEPHKSRVPGLILGVVLALPVIAVCVVWVIPTFVGTVLGGARDLDERLRATDRYMRELCGGQIEPERDEGLCGCVWSVEFPSLDCRPHFNAWATDLQFSRCAEPKLHDAALSYCTCVETIETKMNDAGEEPEQRRGASNAYENCEGLQDAVALPPAAELAPPYD